MADVNDALFVKVLAQIERDPETWSQGDWIAPSEVDIDAYLYDQPFTPACGTAFCFAGHVAHADRRQWIGVYVIDDDGRYVRVGEYAMRRLGLDPSTPLFHADNTLDDLYRISAAHMGIDEQVLRDKVAAEVQS